MRLDANPLPKDLKGAQTTLEIRSRHQGAHTPHKPTSPSKTHQVNVENKNHL
jgi:hypothetical protein